MRYALIKIADGSVQALNENIDPAIQTKQGFQWRPCPVVFKPAFALDTETVEGPTYTTDGVSVTEVWTKRNLTAAELDAHKTQDVNNLTRLQFLVAFDMENRVRVLEGKPTVTIAQYKTALRAAL